MGPLDLQYFAAANKTIIVSFIELWNGVCSNRILYRLEISNILCYVALLMQWKIDEVWHVYRLCPLVYHIVGLMNQYRDWFCVGFFVVGVIFRENVFFIAFLYLKKALVLLTGLFSSFWLVDITEPKVTKFVVTTRNIMLICRINCK